MCSAALPCKSYTPKELTQSGKAPAGKVFEPHELKPPPGQPELLKLFGAHSAWFFSAPYAHTFVRAALCRRRMALRSLPQGYSSTGVWREPAQAPSHSWAS